MKKYNRQSYSRRTPFPPYYQPRPWLLFTHSIQAVERRNGNVKNLNLSARFIHCFTMSTSGASNANENAGVAFAIVLGAGAATAIGASVVFFPSLVKLTSQRVLAASLGLSAGVMTYVSFVEIFAKSVVAFTNADHGQNMAYIYSTLSFFGGVVLMKVGVLMKLGVFSFLILDYSRFPTTI